MSKRNDSFDEAQSTGLIRGELVNIQLDLSRGAKRTLEKRRQAWKRIRDEAHLRFTDLENQANAPKPAKEPVPDTPSMV